LKARLKAASDFAGDHGDLDVSLGEEPGGELHAPLGQILNRRTPHQMDKTIGERGSRGAGP